MKRLAAIGALSAVGLALMVGPAVASAATEFGDPCTADGFAPEVDLSIFTLSSPSPLPVAAPTSGIVTSWSSDLAEIPAAKFGIPETFQLYRVNPGGKTVTVVGSDTETLVPGHNTFPTRIPVGRGDVLGLATTSTHELIFCEEVGPETTFGAFEGTASIGATAPLTEIEEPIRLPVTAKLEPDADGDGFGDESQDQCPTDATTQGPCPMKTVAPPPPPPAITLSASALAKKSLVTVTVTVSAATNVTVGGSVKLGKGKTAKLGGKAEAASPGTFTKFNLPFPAKLKAALKLLPPSKKLSLSLSVSAPGATKTLTVKAPGQEKAPPHHSSKA
jgi:hypothetical protein